ncbi:MAG: hypothetical protein ABSB41_20105 [Anaerolineales bacterium]|jgi:hypothetical protein
MDEKVYFWCRRCMRVYSKQEWEGQGTMQEMTCPGCGHESWYNAMPWSDVLNIHKDRSGYPKIPKEGKKYQL